MKAWLTLIAALVTASVVAGCGDDSDTLSSNELIKQADAVCKAVNAQAAKLPTPTDVGTVATTVTKTIAILEPAQEKLESLKPPDDKKVAYEAWVTKTEEVIKAAKQSAQAAKKGDGKALRRGLRQGIKTTGQARTLAAEVGLKVCGSNQP